MIFGALLDSGDEILVPDPPYTAFAEYYGAKPVSYETIESENWTPNVEDTERKVKNRTEAIVIINPDNLTGSVYPREKIKDILDIAAQYDIPVVADEIYAELIYEVSHTGTAPIKDGQPLIVLNGFSKVYLATGWRLDYMYFQDLKEELADLKDSVIKLARIRLCPNTPSQYGALAGMERDKKYLEGVIEKLKERRDYFLKRLNGIPGLTAATPKGGFYVFP